MAEETSNPLPTFPCARQWTYCATLCANDLPSSNSNGPVVMTEKCTKRAVTSDVIRAADDPRPVLCTCPKVRLVNEKGGIFFKESIVEGRPSDASYK